MKASKCNFANKYTKLLGHVVTRNMIKSNQEKIDTVRLYPQSILYCPTIPSIYTILSDYPKSTTQIKSFKELVLYNPRFIKGFSEIAVPLYQLAKTRQTFHVHQTPDVSASGLGYFLI